MLSVITGFWLGMSHVLTGPDHLAAVAPLATHKPKRAWIPGARWGLGHSAGVTVVGLLSLWFRDKLPVESLSLWGERIVGVMLIALGFWGLRRALKHRLHAHEHEHDGERHLHIHVHAGKTPHEHDSAHHHSHTAFGFGILHGVAGSSHFLGVLPTLMLPTTGEAIAYLAAFAVGTVLAMASFSWFMGFMAQRCERQGISAYRNIMGMASGTAILIGFFWLAA